MRIVLQRVTSASVRVGGAVVAQIDAGLVALVGVAPGDGPDDARALARKTARLRVFDGGERGGELSVAAVGGSVLVVSQFTLMADTRRGNRPSWSGAAAPEDARALVDAYATAVADVGVPVQTGSFGTHMAVELVNDGPVTLILDSRSGDPVADP